MYKSEMFVNKLKNYDLHRPVTRTSNTRAGLWTNTLRSTGIEQYYVV